MNNIGIIGLGVMGQNLALNLSEQDIKVSVFNRTFEVTEKFLSENHKNIFGFADLPSFVNSLELPRKILLLVKAGDAVDEVINFLKPLLQKQDIIIDTGNSFYTDSDRRYKQLESDGFRFIGLGISGGEEGARHGASFMAGGDKSAFDEIKIFLDKAAAIDFKNTRCVGYFGYGGAGHFVKMVHNGIEYVDMQLIADIYSILKLCNKDNNQIANIFKEINDGRSGSYLIEITEKILRRKDEGRDYLIDKIMDTASQKGTGQWASITSLNNEIPAFSFANAVYTRFISSLKNTRIELSKIYNKRQDCLSIPPQSIEKAYYAAKILAYAQGLEIIQTYFNNKNLDIDMAEVVRVWQGGCIIRAKILKLLEEIFKKDNEISNILINDDISKLLKENEFYLRQIISGSILNYLAVPGLSSALEYFDLYTTEKITSNLVAAQRDFFGAHGYRRVDIEGDFHTEWEG